jgi:hypothetical protein
MRLKFLVVGSVLALGLAACGPSPSGGGGDGGPLDCPDGFASCDGNSSTGCETDLSTISDCGACGNVCSQANGTATCAAGVCSISCSPGFGDCDNDPSNGCESSLDSANHCGACYNSCNAANAQGMCVGGGCQLACNAGWGDCNMDLIDGCETELIEDQRCGACDMGCTSTCVDGACETCDAGLAMASMDPFDAAKAMGICGGLVDARWALPDGEPPPDGEAGDNFHLGHGILPGFGQNVAPRQGTSFLALSSGTARRPSDPGYRDVRGFSKGYTSGHPDGFPKESPSCPGVTTGTPNDGIALELELEVPEWGQGLAFDFTFYTWEWPSYVCSTFNDFFVAVLEPYPMGQTDGNISFDSMGNPVSVNSAFVSVCGCSGGPPCTAGTPFGTQKTFTCPLGTGELQGTGFEGFTNFLDPSSRAATGWLTTTAPVEPGTTITLKLIIYDSGDGDLDSTVLVDNFRWLAAPPDVVTEPID